MSRSFGVILTALFPVTAIIASAAMFPLILQNSPPRLLLVSALILSPVIAVFGAMRFQRRYFYLTVFGVLAFQLAAEAILNYW